MPLSERAAQFMPFAALTGYDAAIAEAGRQTEEFREMDESEKAVLDETLRALEERKEERPEIKATYFVPDPVKDGGAYVEVTGKFVKVDRIKRVMLLEGGTRIPLDEITRIMIQ